MTTRPHSPRAPLAAARALLLIIAAAAASLALAGAFSARAIAQPRQSSAKPAPAAALPQDSHEGVTISAEPFPSADPARKKFGNVSPQKAGILAVNVTIQNDRDQAVQLDLDSIVLEVQTRDTGKQQLEPMDIVQVAEYVAYPGGLKAPSERRFPIGLGGSSPDKKVQKIVDELKPFTLEGDIAPPHGKLSGCLYFNLAHEMQLTNSADLYIPDVVQLPSKKPLLFFDIALGSAAELP